MMNTAKKPMSDERKAALKRGREQAAAVRAYLEYLESNKPKRGRKRTPESVGAQLASVVEELSGSIDPLKRLKLVQRQLDLEEELRAMADDTADPIALRDAFIANAQAWAENNGVSREAFRFLNVPAKDLNEAGIK